MDEYIFNAGDNRGLDAEAAVAGSILIDPTPVLDAIRKIVSVNDFQSGAARAIYSAGLSLLDSGSALDTVTIQAAAEALDKSASNEYCADVMKVTPTAANVEAYAQIVHRDAIQRRAGKIGFQLQSKELTPLEAIAALQELSRSQSATIHTPAEAAQDVMDFISGAASGKTRPFISTGFRDLDYKLAGGLVSGGLITLAARPGTGKTTAGICIAENVAASGKPVLYVSLEMTERQIWCCRLANVSGLDRSVIASGRIREDDRGSWASLTDALTLLHDSPFMIRETPSAVEDVEREARCQNGLALIVVDHIGLIKSDAGRNRYEAVTEITHKLKQLALSLQIPILALCQLNRASVQREDKRPNMADLRDSGAIEEDSDVVCLLHRPAVYLPEEEQPDPGEVQDILFIIDKNRHGTTGIVHLDYCGKYSRISNPPRSS